MKLRTTQLRLKFIYLLFILCFFPPSILLCYDPLALYLTWQRNPESTMTIQWISPLEHVEDVVEYRENENETWKSARGIHSRTPNGYNYLIHCTELIDLKPGTSYSFRLGQEDPVFRFRTMPKTLTSPINFIVGGDVYHDGFDIVEQMNRVAAKTNPYFALVGGDLAYSCGRTTLFAESFDDWLKWLKAWKTEMVTSDGYLIPMIPIIGNHDVLGGYNQPSKNALFFYALFAMPGFQGYNSLNFGQYLSILLLDSGHTNAIDGTQTSWIAKQLKQNKEMLHKIAIYHVGAYPSVRSQNNTESKLIRKSWVPLFERYGLNIAFEHHDHAYKRTHLISNNKVNTKGVLYMGDGAWGIEKPRTPKTPDKLWYLAKSGKTRHIISVILSEHGRVIKAIDADGNVFDEYEQGIE